MENFKFFYLITEAQDSGDWRMRMIWHRTKTGARNRIKVKSLPKDEQWKYAPPDIRAKHFAKLSQSGGVKGVAPEQGGGILKKEKRVFTVYYSADRPKAFDEFYENKLVVCTDDSAKAIDIESQGHKIAVAHQVPLDAFIKYYDYDKSDWVIFPKDMKEEEKFEKIKWTDNDLYLCDFFKYKDGIDFQLSSLDKEEEKE